MSKTQLTKQLEKYIFNAINKQGVFCCFEVTLGWVGKERVDMLSYDTKGIFRCFEIKSSVEDFHSTAKKSFCGHYNYFVITPELYEKIKNEIPEHIGIYIQDTCVKKAKKQVVSDETIQMLKDSMIRSLSRYTNKIILQDDEQVLSQKNREISALTRQKNEYRTKYQEMLHIYEPRGRRFNENNGIIDYIKQKTEREN